MDFECSFWMLRPWRPHTGGCHRQRTRNNMGCLWQPLKPTMRLLHNIDFPKVCGLHGPSIQKLHSKSIHLSKWLNFLNKPLFWVWPTNYHAWDFIVFTKISHACFMKTSQTKGCFFFISLSVILGHVFINFQEKFISLFFPWSFTITYSTSSAV